MELPTQDQILLARADCIPRQTEWLSRVAGAVRRLLTDQKPINQGQLDSLVQFYWLPVQALLQTVREEQENVDAAVRARAADDRDIQLSPRQIALIEAALQVPSWRNALQSYRAAVEAHTRKSAELSQAWDCLQPHLTTLYKLGDRLRYMAEHAGEAPGLLSFSRGDYYLTTTVTDWESRWIAALLRYRFDEIRWVMKVDQLSRGLPAQQPDIGSYSSAVDRSWAVLIRLGDQLPDGALGWTTFPWTLSADGRESSYEAAAACQQAAIRAWEGTAVLDVARVVKLVCGVTTKFFQTHPPLATITFENQQGRVTIAGKEVRCETTVTVRLESHHRLPNLDATALYFPETHHAIVYFRPQAAAAPAAADEAEAPDDFPTPPDGLMESLQALRADYRGICGDSARITADLRHVAVDAPERHTTALGDRRRAAEATWADLGGKTTRWLEQHPPAPLSDDELALAAQVAGCSQDDARGRIHAFSAAFQEALAELEAARREADEAQRILGDAHAIYWKAHLARDLDTEGDAGWVMVPQVGAPDPDHLGVRDSEDSHPAPKTAANWKGAAMQPHVAQRPFTRPGGCDLDFEAAVKSTSGIHIRDMSFLGRQTETSRERCERLERETSRGFKEFAATVVKDHMWALVDERYRSDTIECIEVPMVRHYWYDGLGNMSALTCFQFYQPEGEELGYIVMYASLEPDAGGQVTIRCSPLHEDLPLTPLTLEEHAAAMPTPAAARAPLPT